MNHTQLPTLNTPRLILRPFRMTDTDDLAVLANDKEIALNTENFPYPYEKYMAEKWINQHQEFFLINKKLLLAIVTRKKQQLIGVIGLDVNTDHDRAVLGYWLGRPFWGQGYATEAAKRLLHYGFKELQLQRICSSHLKRNPKSGQVLKKLGMQYEGCQVNHIKKFEQYEDVELYGILKSQYEKSLINIA